MKFFRDLNDYLDAELVSNIVIAAFSLFIEVGAGDNPWDYAAKRKVDSHFTISGIPLTQTCERQACRSL